MGISWFYKGIITLDSRVGYFFLLMSNLAAVSTTLSVFYKETCSPTHGINPLSPTPLFLFYFISCSSVRSSFLHSSSVHSASCPDSDSHLSIHPKPISINQSINLWLPSSFHPSVPLIVLPPPPLLLAVLQVGGVGTIPPPPGPPRGLPSFPKRQDRV